MRTKFCYGSVKRKYDQEHRKYDIKTDVKQVRGVCGLDTGRQRAFVNTVMNLWPL
jgi:hypothetical protein